MKYEKEYMIGLKDVGRKNQITNYAILSFLEETGSFHSSLCGYGVNDIEKKGKGWILMDWKLKVFKRIRYAENILIKTWTRPIEKNAFYTYRDYEVFCNNEKIAIATSKWVLLDIEKRRITKISNETLDGYKPESIKVFEEEDIEKIKEPIDGKLMLIYDVKRSDIDMIEHMHNLNYLNLAYEALPKEIYEQDEKCNVRIMYKHQIVFGEKIKCYYSKSEDKEIVTLKSYDDSILHAIIELS